MPKQKTEGEQILSALESVDRRLQDLFILEASRAGIKRHEIRSILGIGLARVTKVARHVKTKDE
jgi:hypothetical protein